MPLLGMIGYVALEEASLEFCSYATAKSQPQVNALIEKTQAYEKLRTLAS